MDPRRLHESTTHTTMADLDLLVAESDRDDPFLLAPQREDARDTDDIDDQILAGLVTP